MTWNLAGRANLHSGQTQKSTSHPVVSALKICINSKSLRSEVRKKALLEIQWQNKVRGDKLRGKQTGTCPQILNVYSFSFQELLYLLTFSKSVLNFPEFAAIKSVHIAHARCVWPLWRANRNSSLVIFIFTAQVQNLKLEKNQPFQSNCTLTTKATVDSNEFQRNNKVFGNKLNHYLWAYSNAKLF